MLIDELKSDYLDYVNCFKSSGTYHFYFHHLNAILKYLDVVDTDDITKKNIFKYVNLLQKNGLSNKTINYRILSLKTMLKFGGLVDHEILSIPKLRFKDFRYENLTRVEINKLVKYIFESKIKINSKLILSLLLETGMRLNELTHVKNENIDIDKKMIYLDVTKNGVDRIVFYGDLTNKYINLIRSKKTYLIDTAPRGIYAIFQRANAVLKFKKFHPHMFRHTYATVLVENNTNLEFVRITLGHKSLKTTQRYLHFNYDVMRNIYDHNFKY